MKSSFDEDYFERGVETGASLYSNYRWIPELTIPLAYEIIKIAGLNEGDRVLDYGCAKGFLVKAFRLLHIDAFGVDISQYAISKAPQDIEQYVAVYETAHLFDRWNLIVAKDVLEHITVAELHAMLDMFSQVTPQLLVAVPIGDGEKYNILAYELDKTHVIRQTLPWWKEQMERFGFNVEARYRWGHIKENWGSHPEGNGILLGKK